MQQQINELASDFRKDTTAFWSLSREYNNWKGSLEQKIIDVELKQIEVGKLIYKMEEQQQLQGQNKSESKDPSLQFKHQISEIMLKLEQLQK